MEHIAPTSPGRPWQQMLIIAVAAALLGLGAWFAERHTPHAPGSALQSDIASPGRQGGLGMLLAFRHQLDGTRLGQAMATLETRSPL